MFSAPGPKPLVALLIDTAKSEQPPLPLFAGQIANDLVPEKRAAVTADQKAWLQASQASGFLG